MRVSPVCVSIKHLSIYHLHTNRKKIWKKMQKTLKMLQYISLVAQNNFFLPYHDARGILVPWPGTEPVPFAVEAWSFKPWTTREVPQNNLVSLLWFCFYPVHLQGRHREPFLHGLLLPPQMSRAVAFLPQPPSLCPARGGADWSSSPELNCSYLPARTRDLIGWRYEDGVSDTLIKTYVFHRIYVT